MFFTYIAVIRGKIYSNDPKNMNNIHKGSKDLVSVIINIVTNINGGETVFYDEVKQMDMKKKAHVLKHLHERMILGPFEIFSHEEYFERGNRAVISFIIKKKCLCIYFVVRVGFITNI